MDELEWAKKRCRIIIEKMERLENCTHKITPSSQRTLFKLALSELAFLSRSSSLFTSLSVNIGHIEALVHILQQPFINGVSRVCKPVRFSPSESVHVDVVCTLNKNPVWIIVSDRNPMYIFWNESRKSKGLRSRIKRLLVAARSSVALKPESIVLFFAKGLNAAVYEKARDEFGAVELGLEFSVFDFAFDEDVDNDWVNLVGRTYRDASVVLIKVNGVKEDELNPECGKELVSEESDSVEERKQSSFFSVISIMLESRNVTKKNPENPREDTDFINFDTTALIALVSGISNGGVEKLLATPEAELKRRFKGNYEFVVGQVKSEIQSPIHEELKSELTGKRCIICQTVCSEFKELVSMCGGPNENLRADQLLRNLMVVADSPSERMMSLPTTRKLAIKNKIIFGTGDYWHAPTLTANMAFVRAISQTGMSLFTVGHRPQALTGD